MNQLSGLPGHQVGILRQELDSMVRAIWLVDCDAEERQRLAEMFQEPGELLRDRGGRITDARMVNLANQFHGWTKRVYKLGCAFIHLSLAHDFQNRDPFIDLSSSDRREIIEFISQYHFVQLPDNFGFMDVVPLLPRVFDKIRSNLLCELQKLETDTIGD
ncbi:MAG: hypothetical protein SFX74_08195 [Fimbriimonadaceae bacterium]|nr:hypothetical protein [Fimbriimonadaceae bacterium]